MAETKKRATIEGTVVPDNAKIPQDRKSKATAAPDTLTADVRGKSWTVPADALDDFELLDDLNALDQKNDVTRMPSVLRRLLGDQWREAMELLRDKDTGRVSVESGAEFVFELMGALNPNS